MRNPVSAVIRVGESKNPIKDSVGVFGNVLKMELNQMQAKHQHSLSLSINKSRYQ